MRVLITGSSGYLGTLVTNYLISKHISVSGIGLGKYPKVAENEYFNYYSCDVADRERLAFIFREQQPTHVIHLASTFNKVRNRKREYSVDIGGSKNIVEITNSTSSVKQLIYSSSAVVYGAHNTNPVWIPESFPLNPGKYRYGLNKSMVEEMILSTPVRKNLHLLTLRICQVTGPSSSNRNFLKLLLKSPVLPSLCMDNKIQLLHESDFLELLIHILNDDEIEGTYNMAPDNYASISDLAPYKLYLPLPLPLISALLSIFWHLRILNFESVSVNNGIFPIIIDPTCLMNRYDYKFRYSTMDAFTDTVLNDKWYSEALKQLRREIDSRIFKRSDM